MRSRIIDTDIRMSDKFLEGRTEEQNFIYALTDLSENARGSRLSDLFEDANGEAIEFLSRSLGVSRTGAVLLSVFVEKGSFHSISYEDVAEFLGLSNTEMLKLDAEMKELRRSGYIRRCAEDLNGCDTFRVPKNVLDGIVRGEAYVRPPRKRDTPLEVFAQVDEILQACRRGESVVDTCHDIKDVFAENLHIPMVKALHDRKLSYEEYLILFGAACNAIFRHAEFDVRDIDELFGTNPSASRLRRNLSSGRFPSIEDGYIEPAGESLLDGMCWALTRKAGDELFPGLDLSVSASREDEFADLIDPGSIVEKELFYGREARDVAELTALLDQEKYADVTGRLASRGMRKGFGCLLYGGPGTGKTETVLQIARKTGRPIYRVDVSDIKTKWHGESEQNAKRIFETYAKMVARCKVTPILFLNEADAILGQRRAVAQAADQSDNSIQNIFLEGLENLEGILIATTNLETALDPAFERRFIYKCRFGKPDSRARAAIWKSMIPEIDEDVAARLAEDFPLSGGQVENVARKVSVRDVLYGDADLGYRALSALCESETLAGRSNHRHIGF